MMETHRRLLRGPLALLWLLASLGAAGYGGVRQVETVQSRRAAVARRDTAAGIRAQAREARDALNSEYAAATQGAEAGSRPLVLPMYAALLTAELDPLKAEWEAAETGWIEAGRRLNTHDYAGAAAPIAFAEERYRGILSGRIPALRSILGRIRDAGPRAREALARFESEESRARGEIEAMESREVPGLREKYRLADSSCRFRLPEARELLAGARVQHDRARSLLETPVQPYGIPDEPEAREAAVRALDLCTYAVTAAKKRLGSASLCNERYDILRERLDHLADRRAEAATALRALWAEHLPRYGEGLQEQIEKSEGARLAVEACLVSEIEKYKVQDFDGALLLLDQALEILRQAFDALSAPGRLLVELNRCRSECPVVLAEAERGVEAARQYLAAHAGDVGTDLRTPLDPLQEAEAHRRRREWREAHASARKALQEAASVLSRAKGRVRAAEEARERARRKAAEAAERARRAAEEAASSRSWDNDSSSSDWGSSSSDWSSSGDSGGSWGDSGSDSGW